MRTTKILSLSVTVFATIALSACNSSQDQHGEPATANSGSVAQGTDAAVSASQFSAQLALHGVPAVSTDGKFIVVTVDLSNNGSAVMETKGFNPINLGAHSIDADGKVISNDLARAALPSPIAPKNHALISISLPTDKTLGYSAQILPVRENVGWFDEWGTKPLVVGPFTACGTKAQGQICDASGKALSVSND
ncbi:hypothetical protein HFP05_00280 [Rhodanobacter denitrificans]|nr:hypothetical protein [Rhodanobacter denitrificans]